MTGIDNQQQGHKHMNIEDVKAKLAAKGPGTYRLKDLEDCFPRGLPPVLRGKVLMGLNGVTLCKGLMLATFVSGLVRFYCLMEPAKVPVPLVNFDFDAAQSMSNARWAMIMKEQAAMTKDGQVFRPPLVIIAGLSGTGKSKLAAQISGEGAFFGNEKGGLMRILNHVAAKALPVAVVDNVFPEVFADKDLVRFLTAQTWAIKKRGSTKMQNCSLRTLLVFTTQVLPPLSDDLMRRSLVINLELSPHTKQCNAALSLLRSELRAIGGQAKRAKLRDAYRAVIDHVESIRFSPF